jgi:predicted nucleic acid-binding protein
MPTKTRQKIYWDSCCWLSYINGIPDRLPVLDDILADNTADKGTIRIYTSMISEVEVAYGAIEQYSGKLDPQIEQEITESWADRDAIKLIEFHELIGNEAKQLMRMAIHNSWKLKPLDAIHLATAKSINADEIHTYDAEIFKYSQILGITICVPHTINPRLI